MTILNIEVETLSISKLCITNKFLAISFVSTLAPCVIILQCHYEHSQQLDVMI